VSLSQGYEAAGAQDQFIVGGAIVSVRGAGLSGVATIPAGQTSITVNHSLGNGLTPKVFVEPQQDMGTIRKYVTNRTASSFKINISASSGSALVFDWSVSP
jgi:hypothetical protein